MKLTFFIFSIIFLIVTVTQTSTKSFLDKLFSDYGGHETSYGYGNSYGNYRPRSYGRSYGNNEDGGDRYKSICRVHAISSVGFPGRIGNPVCPY